MCRIVYDQEVQCKAAKQDSPSRARCMRNLHFDIYMVSRRPKMRLGIPLCRQGAVDSVLMQSGRLVGWAHLPDRDTGVEIGACSSDSALVAPRLECLMGMGTETDRQVLLAGLRRLLVFTQSVFCVLAHVAMTVANRGARACVRKHSGLSKLYREHAYGIHGAHLSAAQT